MLSHSQLSISTDRARIDHAWLFRVLGESYWGARINKIQILKAIDGSLCFGAYTEEEGQIGFARVVTDGAFFSSVMDVIVDERFRHQGVGKKIMESVVEHPSVKTTICILDTRYADDFYAKFGFVRGQPVMKRDPS